MCPGSRLTYSHSSLWFCLQQAAKVAAAGYDAQYAQLEALATRKHKESVLELEAERQRQREREAEAEAAAQRAKERELELMRRTLDSTAEERYQVRGWLHKHKAWARAFAHSQHNVSAKQAQVRELIKDRQGLQRRLDVMAAALSKAEVCGPRAAATACRLPFHRSLYHPPPPLHRRLLCNCVSKCTMNWRRKRGCCAPRRWRTSTFFRSCMPSTTLKPTEMTPAAVAVAVAAVPRQHRPRQRQADTATITIVVTDTITTTTMVVVVVSLIMLALRHATAVLPVPVLVA